MNRLLLDFRLTLRSTPIPCLDCSRDLWPWNLRRLKPSIMVLAKLEKRAYRSWKRWLTSWCLEPSNPFCSGFFGWLCNKLRIPDCSPYQVVILTSLGTEDPSTLTSVIWIIQRFYKKILSCYCLPSDWHSRQYLPLENIYCLPLLFVWIALLMIDRQTSCQKFMFTSDLKISKFLSAVTYFLL